jgi:hypothetical protein
MTDEAFWVLISELDWDKTGDDEAVIEPVVASLARMSASDIADFEDIMSEKLFGLDTSAHARNIGSEAYPGRDDYFSVDWFLYVRCCAVANGKAFYQRALTDPTAMPKDMEFEALLSIAGNAYERKTGRPFEHAARIDYETFSNKHGWEAADHTVTADEPRGRPKRWWWPW